MKDKKVKSVLKTEEMEDKSVLKVENLTRDYKKQSEGNKKKSRSQEKKCRNHKGYGIFSSVPSMALILLVKVQSRVFTAKCSEPQVGTSNGMDEGSGVTKFLSLRTET